MGIKVSEFIRQIVGIRDDIEGLLAELLLEFDDINTKSILTSQLETVWEVVDLLVLV